MSYSSGTDPQKTGQTGTAGPTVTDHSMYPHAVLRLVSRLAVKQGRYIRLAKPLQKEDTAHKDGLRHVTRQNDGSTRTVLPGQYQSKAELLLRLGRPFIDKVR